MEIQSPQMAEKGHLNQSAINKREKQRLGSDDLILIKSVDVQFSKNFKTKVKCKKKSLKVIKSSIVRCKTVSNIDWCVLEVRL